MTTIHTLGYPRIGAQRERRDERGVIMVECNHLAASRCQGTALREQALHALERLGDAAVRAHVRERANAHGRKLFELDDHASWS